MSLEDKPIADLLQQAEEELERAAQAFESKQSALIQLRDMVNSLRKSRGFL